MKAINYHHRAGSTHVDFRGTELMPAARGDTKAESRLGSTKIGTHLVHMSPASQYGPEYLTYVLWAVTPEGRATNLGEVALEGDHANLLSSTDLQSFGLIVTAEPYFAVTQPSDVVVAVGECPNRNGQPPAGIVLKPFSFGSVLVCSKTG
jgi:hypothetical protein